MLHRAALLSIPTAIVAVCIFVKSCEKRHHLSFVPAGLHVTTVLYTEENSAGFGPGGNESGILVYELPESSAAAVQLGGTAHLRMMQDRPRDANDWHGLYKGWQPTPVLLEGSGSNAEKISSYDIEAYLDRYGFGVSLKPEFRNDINKAISEPGAFVGYGRIGILIVIPRSRKVVYIYNG